ncbi:MAG: DUF177 domain-containing protein [Deltaproteobacteria bacterium]|nr:DUF177 domain-containing protein [Deltaproteobacteria bacterium]
MLVKLSDLTRGRRRLEFSLPVVDVREAIGDRPDIDHLGGAHVVCDAELVDRTLNLRGDISIGLRGACDRCADDFEAAIRLPWRLILVPSRHRPGPEVEDIEFGYYSGEILDLARHALDGIGLSFPEILLCRPDCKGICPDCRANLNREPCRCPS